jgi:hypothetical protein
MHIATEICKMSKYMPLRRFLESRSGGEVPMSFDDVERVLGFPLPDSARQYPAWWSNNTGTHVGVKAWRDAGFRTSRVDLGSERVTFVREEGPSPVHSSTTNFGGMEEGPIGLGIGEAVYGDLSSAGQRLVDDWCEARHLDHAGAIVEILDRLAQARQMELIATLPRVRMPEGHDSVAWIRGDRDNR